MTPQTTKQNLAEIAAAARTMADMYRSLSTTLRTAPAADVVALVDPAADGGSVERAVQLARMELAALDKALALYTEDLIARVWSIRRGWESRETTN